MCNPYRLRRGFKDDLFYGVAEELGDYRQFERQTPQRQPGIAGSGRRQRDRIVFRCPFFHRFDHPVQRQSFSRCTLQNFRSSLQCSNPGNFSDNGALDRTDTVGCICRNHHIRLPQPFRSPHVTLKFDSKCLTFGVSS